MHEGKKRSRLEIANFACQYIKEYEAVQIEGSPVKQSNPTRWETPKDPFVKANFDAALRNRGHKSGTGIMIRDSRGQILGSKALINTNVPSTFAAEALACVQSLSWGKELGFQYITVEGNSLSVIKKVKDNSEKIDP